MRARTSGLAILAVVAFIASAAFVASAALFAQTQTDRSQFRTGVELLQLDVAVLDGKRQPVRGLTADDFTVLDNGKPTPIRAFTPVELAPSTTSTEAVWSHEVPPDVTTNNVGIEEGRLVVILMDRTIASEHATLMARKIATAAVNALGPNDLAAVVSTKHGAMQNQAVQNLTSDRTRLLRAIEYGDPSTGLSPEAAGIWASLGLTLNPLEDGGCLCGVCVLETITRVANALDQTPRRRKLLLFIGSNIIWQAAGNSSNALACEIPLKDARAAMVAAIDRVNLTVHSIDPQGLANLGPQAKAWTPGAEDKPIPGRAQGSAVVGRLNQQQAETNSLLTGQKSLDVLPARTGGRTIVNQNDPDRAMPAIYRESEAYYVLGIERAPSGRNGDTRSLEVKVKGKNLRVVTQRRYVAQSTQSTAANAHLSVSQSPLTGLLPNAGVPLSLAVMPFANPDGAKSVVRVNVDAGGFARTDGGSVPLDVKVLAVDRTGKPLASATQTSTITGVAPASGAPPEIVVSSHLELPAGDYGIRVEMSEAASGKTASVFGEVIVPSFENTRLSLSGVNLESASSANATPTTTTRRIFHRTDRVRAVFQIYQGTTRSEAIAPVTMRVQIVNAKGTVVRDQSLPFAEATFTNRRADGVITLPLSALPAGEYLLKLDAAADRATSGRSLRFGVE
jgi:VWFA-related protein